VRARANPRTEQKTSGDSCYADNDDDDDDDDYDDDDDDGDGDYERNAEVEMDPKELEEMTSMGLGLFWRIGLRQLRHRVRLTLRTMFEEDMEWMTKSAGKDMAKEVARETGHALLALGDAFKIVAKRVRKANLAQAGAPYQEEIVSTVRDASVDGVAAMPAFMSPSTSAEQQHCTSTWD